MSTAVIEEAKLTATGQADARRKFAEYREVVSAGRGTAVDVELKKAYQQIGMGRTIISLNKAMESAGIDSSGHPVLAVAGATAKWVWFRWNAGRMHDSDGRWWHEASAFVSDHAVNPGWNYGNYSRGTKTGTFRFPRAFFGIRVRDPIRARVPIVPPALRPKGSLANYVLLWEANWQEAPEDPYLLRRITQDLFVVLAQWDLTDVERSVLDMATVGAYKPT
ncbi:hypothetical protein LCGC14_0326020 [marine sediment metagenome]|uniref:Uncharacterized protein n=1 Tax=marine sediment metagenome TaxID=412755 RepID=A0A0F9W568_9ZZZZ